MKTSVDNLINLSTLNKIAKKADTLYYGRTEDGYTIVSDGHFVVKALLFTDMQSGLVGATGVFPANGEMYKQSRYDAVAHKVDMPSVFMECLESGTEEITDTHLSLECKSDLSVRLYDYGGGYIGLDTKYTALLASPARISMKERKRNGMVTFECGSERVTICPVNIGDLPSCLVQ